MLWYNSKSYPPCLVLILISCLFHDMLCYQAFSMHVGAILGFRNLVTPILCE